MAQLTDLSGRMVHVPLSSTVFQGFDLRNKSGSGIAPKILAGGAGTTYLVESDGVVLKPTREPAETELICKITSQLKSNSHFQIPEPIKSVTGSYVYDGWSASTYIPHARGLHKSRGEYTLSRLKIIIDASRAIHTELQKVVLSDADKHYLRYGVNHVWAHAHRCVWSSETDPEKLLAPFAPGPAVDKEQRYIEPINRLVGLTNKLHAGATQNMHLYETASQVVHGDVVGGDNVLFPVSQLTPFPAPSPSAPPPAIIDFSPTLGPADYAEGIILADALVWCGVGTEVIDIAGGPTPQRLDMLRRGLLFRLLSDIGLLERGYEGVRHDIARIDSVTKLLQEVVESNEQKS